MSRNETEKQTEKNEGFLRKEGYTSSTYTAVSTIYGDNQNRRSHGEKEKKEAKMVNPPPQEYLVEKIPWEDARGKMMISIVERSRQVEVESGGDSSPSSAD